MGNTCNSNNSTWETLSGLQTAIKGWLRYALKKNIYFEGKFITKRKHIHILCNRYANMLRQVKEGEEYFTWA